jgi:plasmid stability protein
MKSYEVIFMACLTIRNLDEGLKTKLRLRAAEHGCSMEEEVRNLLRQSLLPSAMTGNLASRIHQRFASVAIDALPIPPRQEVRTPPNLEE